MRTRINNVRRPIHIWQILIFLFLLYLGWSGDSVIYQKERLVPVTCVYSERYIDHRVKGRDIEYLVDKNNNYYLFLGDNTISFRENVQSGDTIYMLITPQLRSDFFPYTKRIAYLEANGVIYYTFEMFDEAQHKSVRDDKIIFSVIVAVLVISLIFSVTLYTKSLLYKMKVKKEKAEKMKRLREAGKLHPKSQKQFWDKK